MPNDLQALSDSLPPLDPESVMAWLTEQEAALQATMEAKLRAIIGGHLNAYANSLVADASFLDGMETEWLDFLGDDVAVALSRLHAQGGLAAWLSAPDQVIPDGFQALWETVTNESAVAYAKVATNRLHNVGQQMWHTIRTEVTDAVANGEGTEKLKERIQTVADTSEFRADTIARTETVGAYNNGDRAGAVALGDFGPVEHSWQATLDRRTRDDHHEADGQCVKFSQPFQVGDVQMMHPHAAGAPAEQVVNCRCTTLDYYPGDTRPDGSVIPNDETDTGGGGDDGDDTEDDE